MLTDVRRRVRTAALALGLSVVLTACVEPDPTGAPVSAPAPTQSGAALPPVPVSDYPGVACDSLVGPDALGALLGPGVTSVMPSLDDAAVLQDGGLVCVWHAASSDSSTAASLSVRLAADGVDHWATFNHWYEHTDWSESVGEINGTRCTDTGCAVHALDGERFLEVDVVAPNGVGAEDVEAVARTILVAAPAPQPVARETSAPGSRSCSAALSETTALDLLGLASTGASYVSTATPSYHLADDSLRRLGAVDCRLLSDDGREVLRFTTLPGGAWVFRDDSPVTGFDGITPAADPLARIVFGQPGAAEAQRGDDWLRVSAPDATEAVLRDLLGELASR